MTSPHRDPSKRYVIYVCPDCGEQLFDQAWSAERGGFYGHYHARPAGWPDDQPDPWFDADEVEVEPVAKEVVALTGEAARRAEEILQRRGIR